MKKIIYTAYRQKFIQLMALINKSFIISSKWHKIRGKTAKKQNFCPN